MINQLVNMKCIIRDADIPKNIMIERALTALVIHHDGDIAVWQFIPYDKYEDKQRCELPIIRKLLE